MTFQATNIETANKSANEVLTAAFAKVEKVSARYINSEKVTVKVTDHSGVVRYFRNKQRVVYFVAAQFAA